VPTNKLSILANNTNFQVDFNAGQSYYEGNRGGFKVKKRALIILTAALWAAAPSRGETRDVPLFDFLLIEPGVRPGGIGKTFTGLADDVNASYYNPGGLALQNKSGVTAMHEPRGTGEQEDIFYDYVAASYAVGKYGTLCGDVIYSDVGNVEMTDDRGNVIGTMHMYMVAPSFYWSYPLRTDLGVGAGVTYAYEHFADLEGGTNSQLLANVGVLYVTPVPGLAGGLAFTHLGPNKGGTLLTEEKQRLRALSWPPPRTMRLGASYKVISNDLNDLTVAADGSKLLMNLDERLGDELGQAVYSGGTEYVYAKMVAVRAGYYRDKWGAMKGLTLGFGFSYKGVGFDYGRVPEGEAFGDRHRLAVSYYF
jgi:hypothetical protein